MDVDSFSRNTVRSRIIEELTHERRDNIKIDVRITACNYEDCAHVARGVSF